MGKYLACFNILNLKNGKENQPVSQSGTNESVGKFYHVL
jgi:hypothetical protein